MRRSPIDTDARVLAVLVVHGEQPWHDVVTARLGELLRARPSIRLLVVDNDSPAAGRIADALGVPVLPPVQHRYASGSFGAAVAAAVNHESAEGAEFLLLLHDDLVLDPDAVDHMLAVVRARPEVAVAGPKLLQWGSEPVLQQVGMTIDAFGRAETHLLERELDQGQHDHRDRTLYVSTAGMLVRADVFRALGGFDPRFTAMREDLDLCWRAWLAGYTVEVVPEAVGRHVGATGRLARGGFGRRATTRYLAERHALAAMIKNLGLLRLAWTLPLHVLLAVAKALGFLLTRRVAAAAAPLAAIAWNGKHLPGTLRLRAAAQGRRQRSDSEIAELFAPGSWRTRAYAEAIADWARGSGTRTFGQEDAVERRAHRSDRHAAFRALDLVRDHPALIIGGLLTLVWITACLPLLMGGQLVGGQVAPWPVTARSFLTTYTAGWGTGPLASGAFPSLLQPVLAVLMWLAGDVAWAAQRLVVVGLVPLAWLTSLRAGRLLTARPFPRVVGATVYAGSPLVLGSFASGRLDALTVAALLPGVVLLAAKATQPGVSAGVAWRASALLAVVTAVAIAAAPLAWPVVVLPLVAVAVGAAAGRDRRRPVVSRLAVVAFGVVGLLLPWLIDRLPPPGAADLADEAPLHAWEALIGWVTLLPGSDGVAGWVWVAAALVVLATAVVLALRTRPGAVLVLLGTAVAYAAATAYVSRLAAEGAARAIPWPPIVALPAALALGGLALLAVRALAVLARGNGPVWRFAVAGLLALAVIAGPVAALSTAVAVDEWPVVRPDGQVVPLFVSADAERVGPYRVLILAGDDGAVSWDVNDAMGPQMTDAAATSDRNMVATVGDVVDGLLAGRADAAGRAGLLGIRYVVLRDAATLGAVAPRFADLSGLEPMAAGAGRVYEVRTWLPRAAVVDRSVVDLVRRGQPVPDGSVTGLLPAGPGRFGGGPVSGDLLLLSEAADPRWTAAADGRRLQPATDLDTGLPLMAFSLDGGADRVTVDAAPQTLPWWLAWQAFVLLFLLSFALRAPGRAAETAGRRPGSPRGAPAESPVGVALATTAPTGAGAGSTGSTTGAAS